MIRNWTVITQPVKWQSKGLFLRERYLTSQSHPNHKNTTKIISLIGSADTVRKISLLGENFNLNRIIKKSRGRRLESYAMEFCLTLPKDTDLMRMSGKRLFMIYVSKSESTVN